MKIYKRVDSNHTDKLALMNLHGCDGYDYELLGINEADDDEDWCWAHHSAIFFEDPGGDQTMCGLWSLGNAPCDFGRAHRVRITDE